jgi:SAM-dependent methyltransferase
MHPQAHPDRLATMGRLFGLETPPLETCRVLELGCGEGGNLIPAAFSLPRATFLGIDLSGSAVAAAAKAARELNLTNVDVRAADIRDFPAGAGAFDYVVAHGVYSWVPADVRDRLLAICRDHLAPNGVAYISFNTYPGHRLREIARDAMRFRPAGSAAARADDPVRAARATLKAIADGVCGDEPYNAVVRAELARLDLVDERVLFHDDLAECNAPFYFEQFAADAARHGLQYLSDADYAETADRPVRPGLAERLDQLGGGGGGVIAREQYADFFVGRAFRRTLLCRAGVSLRRPVRPEALTGLRVAANVRPIDAAAGADGRAVRRFRTQKGVTLSTNHPAAAAALERLGRIWPDSMPFLDLLRATGTQDAPANRDELGGFLLTAAAGGAVELSLQAPAIVVVEPGERPLASPLARHQARGGDLVTTLTRSNVKLEGSWARELLLLLDGTRDRAALVDHLADRVTGGHLALAGAGGRPDQVRHVLLESLESKLGELARLGLLMQ